MFYPKSKAKLKRLDLTLAQWHELIGEEAYDVYCEIDPLNIYLDHTDGTYSVRGAWCADNLTAEQLRDGILSFKQEVAR